MRRAAIFAGLIAFGLSMVPGWGQPAEAPPARVPRFPYTATGDDHMKEALQSNLATRPPWPIFARTAAAQQQPVVFEVKTDRAEKPSSYGLPARGYAQAVLKVKLGNLPPFEISDFEETPTVVYVAATSKLSAYEIGFRQTENEALNDILPYACARLIRLSGDAAQIQALLQMIERRWPEDIAVELLRGIGPAGRAWADRLNGLLREKIEKHQTTEDVLVALLAVDETRGSAALATMGDQFVERGVYVVRQHFELDRTVRNVGTLSAFPPFSLPKPGKLSPEAADSLARWVRDNPAVAIICARTLLKLDDDPQAEALVKRLPQLAPLQAAEIQELVAENEHWKQERLEDEKRERQREEDEKNERLFEEQEKAKGKPAEN